jgi:hypothetical protein
MEGTLSVNPAKDVVKEAIAAAKSSGKLSGQKVNTKNGSDRKRTLLPNFQPRTKSTMVLLLKHLKGRVQV